jgi:hypothetical protein
MVLLGVAVLIVRRRHMQDIQIDAH